MTHKQSICLFLLLFVFVNASCGGPTSPSGSPSLVVRVVDESTGFPIVDPAFGLRVKLAGPVNSNEAVQSGAASFSNLLAGTYSLTTEYVYGYRQLDVISILVDQPKTLTLPMLSVDDLGVTEVFVRGQGSIPKGGVISIPASGVELTFRGRYQLVNYPRPSVLGIFADPFSAPFEYSSGTLLGGPLTDSEWEFTMSRWLPCDGSSRCITSSESILVTMSDPRGRAGAGTIIMRRLQPWPLTFRSIG